jgi:hypothetical protein
MKTELMTRAAKVELFRKKSGDITMPRYTTIGGVRLVMEKASTKGVTRITIDEFCRAFHGMACPATRKQAKRQMRKLIRFFIEDDELMLPEYSDDHRLAGMIYVQAIPEDDDDGVMELVAHCMDRARKRKEWGEHDLIKFDRIIARLRPDSEPIE